MVSSLKLSVFLRQVLAQATGSAFACCHGGGDRVVTWGHNNFGGDSSKVQRKLQQVQQIQASFGQGRALVIIVITRRMVILMVVIIVIGISIIVVIP